MTKTKNRTEQTGKVMAHTYLVPTWGVSRLATSPADWHSWN